MLIGAQESDLVRPVIQENCVPCLKQAHCMTVVPILVLINPPPYQKTTMGFYEL